MTSIYGLYEQNAYVTNRANDEFVQSSRNTKFADINDWFSFHDKYALVDATKAPFFSHFHGFCWSEKIIEIEILQLNCIFEMWIRGIRGRFRILD